MSLFVKKQMNYTFTFTEEELRILYDLVCSYLRKAHDEESDVSLNAEQYIFLGKLLKTIEDECKIQVT